MDWPIGLVILFVLLFAGIPISFALIIVGVLGVTAIIGFDPAMAMLGQVFFDTARS